MSTEPVDVGGNPLDPVRLEDGERLQVITDRFDVDPEAHLARAILHPHAVMDTALRRVGDMGLGQADHKVNAALIGLWVDAFLAGQYAMAESMGIDLDADPLEDEDEA